MPDDDLFPGTPPAEVVAPPEGSPPNGEGETPLTHGDVTNLIEQFVTPNTERMGEITRSQGQLQEGLQAVVQTLQNLGLAGGSQNPEGGTMDTADFITDPETNTRRIADDVVDMKIREQVAPLLGQIVSQEHTNIVNSQMAVVDGKFGPGTWDKEFAPELTPIFDRTRKENPSQLGNREAITNAVRSIMGAKFDTLEGLRQSYGETKAKEAEASQKANLEFVQSNLTGGIHRTAPGSSLTEGMKEHIEREFRATGAKPNEAEFIAAANSGSTLSEWRAAQPEKK